MSQAANIINSLLPEDRYSYNRCLPEVTIGTNLMLAPLLTHQH